LAGLAGNDTYHAGRGNDTRTNGTGLGLFETVDRGADADDVITADITDVRLGCELVEGTL
jgi:hypothetical protein